MDSLPGRGAAPHRDVNVDIMWVKSSSRRLCPSDGATRRLCPSDGTTPGNYVRFPKQPANYSLMELALTKPNTYISPNYQLVFGLWCEQRFTRVAFFYRNVYHCLNVV